MGAATMRLHLSGRYHVLSRGCRSASGVWRQTWRCLPLGCWSVRMELAKPSLVSAGSAEDTAGPHFARQGQALVHIFANGGPSHVDTFDPKPLLAKFHGKPIPRELIPEATRRPGQRQPGVCFPVQVQRCGKSGIEVSELLPQIGGVSTISASSARCTPTTSRTTAASCS